MNEFEDVLQTTILSMLAGKEWLIFKSLSDVTNLP